MTLAPGTRLGPYEIVSPIGAGGMGEVYKARDTRLERIVAIKVITAAIAETPELRQRFEREARTLSTLNHPNICTIHDVGRQGDLEFLVLEFVEGETLAARIERGPMPAEEVIRRGIELAGALDRAHRAGIVHRDLKPANVMLTKAGVKVLDFGLARLKVQAADAQAVTMPSASLTGQGSILGTLHYMSPEQLDGRAVDARSDIFALGIVLYEMATGRRPFEAKSQASLIAAILEHEPPPLTLSGRSGAATPAAFERIVRRCLAKDPDDRWQTARDVVIELEALGHAPQAQAAATPRSVPLHDRRSPGRPMIAAAALMAGAALGAAGYAWWASRTPETPRPELRLQIITPPTPSPMPFAVSPDGRHVVFSAIQPGGSIDELWLRSLDSVEHRRLAGTDGATFPFWSPDSRSFGFFADGKLKRYDIAGAAVQTIAPAALGRGGAWNRDGVILYAPSVGPLYRVNAGGGEPVQVTTVETPKEVSHRFPVFLPDGKRYIYFVQGGDAQGVYLASLDAPKGRRVLQADTRALLLGADVLLFLRQGTLFAQRMDADAAALTGDAVRIADSIAFDAGFNTSALSVSTTGLIAYRTGSASELVWLDRAGKSIQTVTLPEPGPQNCPELSPDGKRIAIDRSVGGNRDLWLVDVARNITMRFTTDAAIDATPVWSPDNTRVLFRSNRTGVNQLWVRTATGAGTEERLVETNLQTGVGDWSPDGRTILFHMIDPATSTDIWAVTLDAERKTAPLIKTPFEERDPQFSPDGKWVAYASNESGRMEICVQAYPQSRGKAQISAAGGSQVRWRRDGRELFYIASDGMLMSVPVPVQTDGSLFEAGTPTALFRARIAMFGGGLLRQQYAVAPDGKRFLFNAVSEAAASAPITVIANWRGLGR